MKTLIRNEHLRYERVNVVIDKVVDLKQMTGECLHFSHYIAIGLVTCMHYGKLDLKGIKYSSQVNFFNYMNSDP